MPPRSNIPIRIGGSRTRSGCNTCKQRHVKCDEGRPICTRCLRADRECVYAVSEPSLQRSVLPARERSDLTVSRAGRYLNQSAWPNLNTSINPHGSVEAVEVHAVQHFAISLGKELAGNFSNDVWCDIIPRVAQHEPSIWHAVVAVGALDTTLRLGLVEESARANNAAIMHYSNAMQQLQIRLEGAGDASCKDVILLSCILFAVFECMQSHYKSALRHISGGMKLLVEWGGEGKLNNQVELGSYLNRSTLQSIFLALDSQAIQMGAVGFRDSFFRPALEDQLHAPTIFSSVEDAHLLLNQIFHRMSHWSNSLDCNTASDPPPRNADILLEEKRIQTQLNEWDSAFKTLLQDSDHQPATLILLVQRKVMQIYFSKHADGPSELEWDKYLPLFEESVILAETYMHRTEPQKSLVPGMIQSKRSRPALTIAMDIVLSLFLIAIRCRDSGLRRRALKMLWTCDLKEGIWDSTPLAGMAEKVIDLEEAAALEDGYVPDSARIYGLDVLLGEERTAEVSHRTLATDNTDGYRLAW